MAQRTREHSRIDPAGRGAGENVDDDAQLYLVADLLQPRDDLGRRQVNALEVDVGMDEDNFGDGVLGTPLGASSE